MIQSEEMEMRLLEMRQKLQVMEWDAQRNQINPAKRVKLDTLRKEFDKLVSEHHAAITEAK